jgi:RNA polymerase sigma-70 factor (ECF subfamily)
MDVKRENEMADPELPDALRDELRASWHRYVDLLAPLRPGLHRYCRRLTGDLWDAEDLVQDTLLRAFATLGSLHQTVENPRAYLFRVATNLWIDTLRRRGSEAGALAERSEAPAASAADPGAVRDAGATVLRRLPPQERAAVLLKDVFEMTLEEIGDVLGTSVGAIKSALHRGRERLSEDETGASAQRPAPATALVDRFVAAYNARDFQGLIALMLDTGSVENVGCGVQIGREAFSAKDGWFHAAVYGHPEWPAEMQYESPRMETAVCAGEAVALGFTTRAGKEALEQVLRFEVQEGRIVRMRGYAFCPETMREVGAELGLRVRTGLYRYPTPAPGQAYSRG